MADLKTPDNFRRVDAPDVLTTFAGFSEMMDRMHAVPVVVTPAKTGRPCVRWTPADDDLLIDLYRQGLSAWKIKKQIGRTYGAIQQRLYVLGYGRA